MATIALCAWLAVHAYRNGAVFLQPTCSPTGRIMDQRRQPAARDRVSPCSNLGYGFFLHEAGEAADATEAFEVLARKLGILLVSLAVLHFANSSVLRLDQQPPAARPASTPPIAPQRWVDDQGADRRLPRPRRADPARHPWRRC